MRLLLSILMLGFFFPVSAFAKPKHFSSCSFDFEDGQIAASWILTDNSDFMYSIMCKWRPNTSFYIGGGVLDAEGYKQMKVLANGRRQVDVTADGCTFQMEFGKKGTKFLVEDNKKQCDRSSSHGGVDELIKLSDSNGYAAICKDGSSTAITLSDTGIYCVIPKDSRSSNCSSNSSFSLMAEWACK